MANWTKEQNDIALQLAMGGSSDDEILRAVASFAPATTPNVPTPPENPQSKENNYGTFNTGSMSDAFKQGGILGVAATAPFTKQAFQAFENAETRFSVIPLITCALVCFLPLPLIIFSK